MHPQLQANLGEHYLNTVLEYPYRQLIIESHSENLIRKIKKLMNDLAVSGDAKSLEKAIAISNLVSCLYVDYPCAELLEEQAQALDNRSPEVSEIILNEKGNFIKRWPNGFFPEREELMYF